MQPIGPEGSVKVFISYAHADQELCKQLQDHLSPLIRSGRMTIWQDQEIPAGRDWEDHIKTRLNDADVILLLVSASFIASDSCSKEVEAALERHTDGTAKVIPIILKPVQWRDTLGQLQALPTGARPVTQWNDLDTAFDDVVQGIQRALGWIDDDQSPENPPIDVTSRILNADYMEMVGQDGRRVLVPASGHIVRLTVMATQTVVLQDLRPIVLSRSEATGRFVPHWGIVDPRLFYVCLDKEPPCLESRDPTRPGFLDKEPPCLESGDPTRPRFLFTVDPKDPEVFELTVLTSNGCVEWTLELSWTCFKQKGILRVDLGGHPFRTMARPK